MAEKSKSPRDLLRALFRRWVLFMVTFFLVCILSLVLMLSWPLKYTGTAIFEIWNTAAMTQGGRANAGAYSDLRNTASLFFTSRPSIEKVLDLEGEFKGLPRESQRGQLTPEGERLKQDMISRTISSLSVPTPVRTENLDRFTVSCTHSDPELARDLPNRLLQDYQQWLKQQMIAQLQKMREYRAEQVAQADEELERAQAARLAFVKKEGKIPSDVNFINERIRGVEDRLRALTSDITLNGLRMKGYEAQLQEFQQRKDDSVQEGDQEEVKVMQPNPERDRMEHFKDAGELFWGVVKRMTEKHPDVVMQRRVIENLRKKVEETPTEVLKEKRLFPIRDGRLDPSFYIELEAMKFQHQALMLEKTEKEQEKARLEFQKNQYGILWPQYEKLQSDETQAEKVLSDRRTILDEVERNLRDESADKRIGVQVVQYAEFPHRPSTPKLMVILMASLVLGLGAAAGLVFLAHLMDRSISTPEEAAQMFDLPVHGVIAEIVTPSQRRNRKLSKAIFLPMVTAVLLTAVGLGVMSHVLRLNRPDEYERWKATPLLYLNDRFVKPITDLVSNLL